MELELPVRCLCTHCGAKLQLPLSKFGARTRCPECNCLTSLTIEHQPVPAFPETLSAEQIRAAFTRSPDLNPPPRSWRHGAGETLAAAVAVLAALGYLLLVGLAAWGLWTCIGALSRMLGGTDVGLFLFELKLLACVVCFGFGVLLLLLISKPLLAARVPRSGPFRTSPELEPGLHALVKRVSDVVGASRPGAVVLDLTAEVSVEFPRPWRSAPVITLGLPLLGVLNVAELAGAIALELGKFSRGPGGWRLRTVHWVSNKFQRALHEQDVWDRWLADSLRKARKPLARWILGLSVDCVAGHRRCLKWFSLLPTRASCFLSQPAEREAKWWAVRISGSSAFESARQRTRFLRMALRRAYAELRPAWEARHRLPDDFTAFILWQEAQLGSALWERVEPEEAPNAEDLAGTEHSVGAQGNSGMVSIDDPSMGLCPRYEGISRSLTQTHYREDLQIEFHDSCLEPVASFVAAIS